MQGRKPIPSDIKRAAGNPGRRPLNEAEPVYTVPQRVPYAPRHLSEDGKRAWGVIAPVLMGARVLSTADLIALELCCDSYGRWISARRKLSDKGEVIDGEHGSYQNPWLAVANRAHEQTLKLLAEFGMTPSSRTRVHTLDAPRQMSLAELLFESATGQDVMVGDETGDGETSAD